MLVDSKRQIIRDKKFEEDIESLSYKNKLFVRLVATKIKFTNITFRYCIFNAVYLRNCSFEGCDFTGCRFLNSNLLGSSFRCCTFDYATFQHTRIDDDILTNNCQYGENLMMHFARSLRLNYQQIGDIKKANKAMDLELYATKVHLKKKCWSVDKYYREKYSGLRRIYSFMELMLFLLLEIVWGNGESLPKLFRTFLICLIIMGLRPKWWVICVSNV